MPTAEIHYPELNKVASVGPLSGSSIASINATPSVPANHEMIFATSFGLVANSTDDQTEKLREFFDACDGGIGYLPEGDYYFNPSLTLEINGFIFSHNTRLLLLSSNTSSNACVTLNEGAYINYLHLHVPTGLTANRGILYKNNTGTNTVKITSDDQINNMANNLHGALQLRGDNVTIEHIEVDKFDKAVLAYIVENIKIGTCRCTNYVTGVYLHSVVNIHFASLHTETASIYATTSPGHSGLLYTGVENLHIAYLYIRNAGEHGVRCGGGLFQTNGVFIAIAFIIECGQCAYKIQDSTGTIPLNHVIGQLTIEDCADTSTPGANEDGLRLENCTGVTISKITVRKRGNTYSAYNGIYMNGARDVELSGQIVDTAADGIYITQDATGLGYTPQKNGNITFNGMAVHRPGVNTNCITVVALIRLDRIFWVNLDLRGQSGTGRTIVIPGVTASTGIDDWSVVQGWQENAGAGTHSIVADASIKVSLTTY